MGDISIRTLCYAHVDLPVEFFGGVPIHSGEGVRTASMVYTLLSEQDDGGKTHHHLIDCGFDEPWIPRFGFYDYELPEVVLGKVGIKTSEIETVFVTHMHFDHVGNLYRFPQAKVVVQEAEYVGWNKAVELPDRFRPMGEQSWIMSSFDMKDIAAFRAMKEDGQLQLAGDGDKLHPSLTGHLSPGGHTFGIQWIEVDTPDGEIVIASDTAMWYSNIEEMWPSGYTNGNTYQMLLTYGEIAEFVSDDLSRVVPGHDMRIFTQFPSQKIGANEVAEVRVASWDTSRLGSSASA